MFRTLAEAGSFVDLGHTFTNNSPVKRYFDLYALQVSSSCTFRLVRSISFWQLAMKSIIAPPQQLAYSCIFTPEGMSALIAGPSYLRAYALFHHYEVDNLCTSLPSSTLPLTSMTSTFQLEVGVLYLLSIACALTEQTQDSDNVHNTLGADTHLSKLAKTRHRLLQHDLHTRCSFHKAHALGIHTRNLEEALFDYSDIATC